MAALAREKQVAEETSGAGGGDRVAELARVRCRGRPLYVAPVERAFNARVFR